MQIPGWDPRCRISIQLSGGTDAVAARHRGVTVLCLWENKVPPHHELLSWQGNCAKIPVAFTCCKTTSVLMVPALIFRENSAGSLGEVTPWGGWCFKYGCRVLLSLDLAPLCSCPNLFGIISCRLGALCPFLPYFTVSANCSRLRRAAGTGLREQGGSSPPRSLLPHEQRCGCR